MNPTNTIHVALCASTADDATIIAEAMVGPGEDVTLGASDVTLLVPEWDGPPMLLIETGALLHLRPGMRVNMCAPGGGDRLVGTFEELADQGVSSPIPIRDREMSIRVRPGLSVFVRQIRS